MLKIAKATFSILLLSVFITSVSAIDSNAANKLHDTPHKPLNIYVQGSFTGIMPQITQDLSIAVQTFKDEVNQKGGILGRQIEVINQDDKADILLAEHNARIAISDPNHFLTIGQPYSSMALASGKLHRQNNKLFIASYATSTEISRLGGTVFQLIFNDEFQGSVLAWVIQNKLSANRPFIITNQSNTYSVTITDSLKKCLKQIRPKIQIYQHDYVTNLLNFDQLIENVKAFQPDVIFLPELKPLSAHIISTLKTSGVSATFLGSDSWGPFTGSPDLIFSDGHLPSKQFYYYTDVFHRAIPAAEAAISAFKEAVSHDSPTIFEGPAILAYQLLHVIKEMSSRNNTVDPLILTELLRGSHYSDVTGEVIFNKDGSTSRNLALLKLSPTSLILDQVIPAQSVKKLCEPTA